MAWKCILGAFIIAFVVREMFHDLFHPSVGGSVSEFIARRVFWVLRRFPRNLPMAAPLSLVLIIFTWALMLGAGFALVYWAVPAWAYRIEPGLQGPPDSFAAAFYFSLEAMTTLGLGDVKPVPQWFRILVTLHTLIAFALITASLTWILLIFPAIARTSRLALMAWSLTESERRTGLDAVALGGGRMLKQLASGVVQFRIDLIHYPLLYYFRAQRDEACMAKGIHCIQNFAVRAAEPHRPDEVRFYAETLSIALDRSAELLAHRYHEVDERDREAVFRAYAYDHVIRLS
ncbi:MAG TPA: potassium channel family protein [Candidatus Limnocylindrales bacterium]|nr:potassium channel family protein [Candidatus Limnocylindrales bacterium]